MHHITDVNLETKTGVCSNCGPVKLKISKGRRRCYYSWKYGAANSAVRPSLDDCCEICGSKERLVFDHDHQTGKHRGWLCHKCNRLLGQANDNIKILEAAIAYLKR
jgi:hypothetical protein